MAQKAPHLWAEVTGPRVDSSSINLYKWQIQEARRWAGLQCNNVSG